MPSPQLIRLLLVLLICGTRLGGATKEAWVEVKSTHFTAYSNAGEAETRKALIGFEGIRSVFEFAFKELRVDAPRPTFVIIVKNAATMQRLLPRPFEGKDPTRPAGYFLSGIDRNYAILRLDVDSQANQPYLVLFHEYTHSIMHQNFPALPTWLDEGIADFYGATEILQNEVVLGRIPMGRLDRLRSCSHLPLDVLLRVTQDSPFYLEGGKTGIFYAQSWAFAHFLFMDEKAKREDRFEAYLKALAAVKDPMAAARLGLGDLDELQHELTLYTRRATFASLRLPLSVKLTDQTFQSRALARAEALVIQAEFLQSSRNEVAARPLLAEALSLSPERPEVHVALGYGHYLRGEQGKAGAAFETAIHLGSRDFRAPYYLAKLAQGNSGQGPQDAAKILDWLEAARCLRPDFPGIHVAIGRQYSVQPRDPARALQAGRLAVALEPQNLASLASLGIACLNLDLEAEARSIGEQLNQLVRTPWERQMADTFNQSLARYLEWRKAPAKVRPRDNSVVEAPSGGDSPPRPYQPSPPLRFLLPSHLAPLGKEVVQLDSQGQTWEAIRRAEQALAKAQTPYDRKMLTALLKTLKRRARVR